MYSRWKAIIALAAVGVAVNQANAQSTWERTNRGLVEVIAGGADSTDLHAMEDLANILDDGATRRIVPVVGKGTTQNLSDIRLLRGIDLGIVQIDAFAMSKTQGSSPENSLTYICKLYNEEFHLLARDSIGTINDLEGKSVNFDVPGSGASITGPLVFQKLKIHVDAASLDPALALEKLKSGEIAAMVVVSAKPTPLFAMLQPKSGLHLLAVPFVPEGKDYMPARLTSEDYPNLVQQPTDTIAVGTVLVVANLVPGTERYRNVANFVDAFFTQFSKLLEPPHHPKWREVNLAAEAPGWRRFPPAEAWLKRNGTPPPTFDEVQLKTMFSRFLDERSRLSGRMLTQQEKDDMFNAFRKWQSAQPAMEGSSASPIQ